MNVKVVVGLIVAIIIVAAAAVCLVKLQEEDRDKFKGIIYDGNGGKTEDGQSIVKVADSDTVENIPFYREGYTFAYWYHMDGDEEIVYEFGEKVQNTSGGLTLKAMWKETETESSE